MIQLMLHIEKMTEQIRIFSKTFSGIIFVEKGTYIANRVLLFSQFVRCTYIYLFADMP